jgi:hypothetical protein
MCAWVNMIVTVITIFIFGSYLDIFVCDNELEPAVIYRERSMQCYSATHNAYLIASTILGVLYYLLISFTFPNM